MTAVCVPVIFLPLRVEQRASERRKGWVCVSCFPFLLILLSGHTAPMRALLRDRSHIYLLLCACLSARFCLSPFSLSLSCLFFCMWISVCLLPMPFPCGCGSLHTRCCVFRFDSRPQILYRAKMFKQHRFFSSHTLAIFFFFSSSTFSSSYAFLLLQCAVPLALELACGWWLCVHSCVQDPFSVSCPLRASNLWFILLFS